MSEPATTVETRVVEEKKAPSSWTGATFGIIAFIIGLMLLGITFRLAFVQFEKPPETALGFQPGKPLDIALVVQSFGGLIIRVLLLLVMSIIGAVIANRGIKMYTDSRTSS